MFKVSQILSKSCRNGTVILPNLIRLASVSTVAEAKSVPSNSNDGESGKQVNNKNSKLLPSPGFKPHADMVAAAFASLKSEQPDSEIRTPFTDEKIVKAKTVNELLSISSGSGVSRRHALKVVSVLAEWSSSGKASLTEFDSDPRFVRLCKILTRSNFQKSRNFTSSRSDDISTILSVTADDEAAKLIGDMNMSQMVKVLSTLSQKKRRSISLLRTLSYNITASSKKFNLKECADILYSISVLNFIDENLLVKLSNDICSGLKTNINKSSVIGSIITSLGILRYKNTELLDALTEWVRTNYSMCRPQDVFSLFMTLGVLNYSPSNADIFYKELLPHLTQEEAGKPLAWLEFVWSLVLLNRADAEHLSSILNDSFLKKLEDSKLMSPSTKMKILNIDVAATYLIDDYKGSRISDMTNVKNVQITKSKDKTEMVDVLVDSLRNLIQNDEYISTNVNSKAGFYIDATFKLDNRCNPLPLATQGDDPNINRIAILAHDYHDMCRGKVEPTGKNVFASKILQKMDYKVIIVPYTEFIIQDKVIHRVQYLENKLKEVVKS